MQFLVDMENANDYTSPPIISINNPSNGILKSPNRSVEGFSLKTSKTLKTEGNNASRILPKGHSNYQSTDLKRTRSTNQNSELSVHIDP